MSSKPRTKNHQTNDTIAAPQHCGPISQCVKKTIDIKMDDDFSKRWERHISALRNEFSTSSVRALTSGSRSFNGDEPDDSYATKGWNDQFNSVVDALDDIALQSPNTITTTTNTTQSPRTPWFTDTETALSSPEETTTSWPRYSHNSPSDLKAAPSTPTPKSRHSLLFPPPKANITAAITPQTTIHSPLFVPQPPPPTSVSVLLLSWAPPTARLGPDGQLLSPSLSTDTDSLRSTLKRRGYKVQCRVIPSDYPTSAVEGFIDRFLYHQHTTPTASSSSQTSNSELMMIYYRGFGWTDSEGRLVFSSGATNTQQEQHQFYWDDVRDPIMQSPSDVLMVFDCTALPSSSDDPREEQEIRLGASAGGLGMVSSRVGTKQVLGVCVPYRMEMVETSSSSPSFLFRPDLTLRELNHVRKPDDSMTRSLCKILDQDDDYTMYERKGSEERQAPPPPVLSVQKLCSLIREDLRRQQQESLASRVFVTQLGGGQLLDIFLPKLERRSSYSDRVGGGGG
ncbi:hypothetical protein QBC44DRAFT_318389 [Cladorrhinum sp. PSN332]|nr:hypothetical protein QBC44DRAFT_318389 [Cladorrhinum sp. PSN332]